MAKDAIFLGDSLERIKAFPEPAKRLTGYELNEIQEGRNPSDFKPMPSIGGGVYEIRISIQHGAFRVLYVAKYQEAIYVLHAFQKKSVKTSQQDINIARSRLRKLIEDRYYE